MNKERNICIVGLGLLGGSYAMGLTDAGYTVTAVDVRPEAIRYALEKGIIAAGAVEDFAPLLAGADAVVLGLYPHALVDCLLTNRFGNDYCNAKARRCRGQRRRRQRRPQAPPNIRPDNQPYLIRRSFSTIRTPCTRRVTSTARLALSAEETNPLSWTRPLKVWTLISEDLMSLSLKSAVFTLVVTTVSSI